MSYKCKIMKKIQSTCTCGLFPCALFWLFLMSMTAAGQKKEDLIFAEGRSWRYEHIMPDRNGNGVEKTTQDYILKVGSDVSFDGRQCKEIISEGAEGTFLYGYGYEQDGCVMLYALFNEPAFYAPFPTEQWVKLYDFNVKEGDHCQMGAFVCTDMIVSEIGWTEDLLHSRHHYIGLSDARIPTWPTRYAVDGVGSSFGLYEFQNIIDNGSGSRFVGCYDGDKCIFSVDDFLSLSTCTGVVKAVTEVGDLYDLHGRRLATPPAKGVYIENGRKKIK